MTGHEQFGWDGDVRRLTIRRLGPADLRGCLILAGQRRWPPEESKWRFLLDVGVAFGIDAPGGGLAGVVVLTCYEGGLAAIGMLLVSPRFGRQGLGRRLMGVALDQAGTATVFLYATAEGRPLYDALGFREVGRVIKYAGEFQRGSPLPDVPVRPAAASDLPELVRLDAAAFGVGRERLLVRLDELAALRCVAATDDGLAGYGAAWPSLDRTVIGPLIADDESTAEALLDAPARSVGF
ncbi:MAG TPA: GNAT family N-acetyltransferase [Streptosporangiaceae bacterium]|nr:GNAT family N-acetyltransferase [Streptosporangiaceae bacterium]